MHEKPTNTTNINTADMHEKPTNQPTKQMPDKTLKLPHKNRSIVVRVFGMKYR